MQAAGNDVHEIRATGGFSCSPEWSQMLAHCLGMDIGFPSGHEGSSFGAALVGMVALGLVESIDAAANLVAIERVVRPQARAAAAHRALLPVFSSLYDALVPTFTALRRLAALLSSEPETGR